MKLTLMFYYVFLFLGGATGYWLGHYVYPPGLEEVKLMAGDPEPPGCLADSDTLIKTIEQKYSCCITKEGEVYLNPDPWEEAGEEAAKILGYNPYDSHSIWVDDSELFVPGQEYDDFKEIAEASEGFEIDLDVVDPYAVNEFIFFPMSKDELKNIHRMDVAGFSCVKKEDGFHCTRR